MLPLLAGSKYRFTLVSGRTVTVILHGPLSDPSAGTAWDISVDGMRGKYPDLRDALGEDYTHVLLQRE